MTDSSDRANTSKSAIAEFAKFLRIETVGGMILLAATAVALIWANSPLDWIYQAISDTRIGPSVLHLQLSVGDWAKDGLLALFFYVAGLELKRELVVGELSSASAAALPAIAAVGGMVVPAVLTLGIGGSGVGNAWSVPVATDIAFALGVLALAGSRMPSSARVFLLSLAVVDDLGAIALIAILFTGSLNWLAVLAAVLLLGLYWFCQHRRIRSPLVYVPLAVLTWFAVHEAGVHATIAGVLLGLLTRVRADAGEAEPPGVRMEHLLQPVSAGVAVPLFALFAAGVPVDGAAMRAVFTGAVPLAVIVGLIAGKFLGITGFAYAAVRLRLGAKPEGLAWRDLAAVAMLGGVGFTVSLLLAELSLDGAAAQHVKAAVLIASAVATLLAALLLARRGRARANRP